VGRWPPVQPEQARELGRRRAGPVVDLAPGQAHGALALDRCVEVALEVLVPLLGGVVPEPSVELDQPLPVGDVAVDDAARGAGSLLADPRRQSVGLLDQGEEPVLQHRAGPVGDVPQHRRQEVPARRPASCGERRLHAHRRRVSALHRPGDRADGPEVAGRLQRDVQRRLVVAHPGRPEVPLDAVVQADGAHDHHPAWRDDAAVRRDRDVDRTVVGAGPAGSVRGAQRRPARERGAQLLTRATRRRTHEHRTPGALHPGGVARVVDEDPREEGREVATAHESSYVVRSQPRVEGLRAGHDAVLAGQHSRESIHVHHDGAGRDARRPPPGNLWMTRS
jgi:hypothetical protein